MDGQFPPLPRRRVLVIDGNSLVGAGMQYLLAQRGDVEVMSMTSADAEGIEQRLADFRPDMVVFDQYRHDVLCSLLENGLDDTAMTFVEVSAELPVVLTYQRRRVALSGVGDLLALIQ